jgi:NAD(P)-dependent dehydrogenase (short-subunit alcohol dehydrogenase family)
MAGRLQGKRAFLTAAAAGMGRSTALAFAREGASVVATDVNEALLKQELGQAAGIECRHLDVLDSKAVADMAKSVGPVDILFNCAGWVHNGTLLDTDESAWDRSFNLNVRAQFVVAKAFLPGMLGKGGGSIVNMASVASSLHGVLSRCAYGASKAAVIGLTKSIAADYIRQNIRCNAICPGTIQTPSLDERINAFADPVKAREAFISRQPLGRLGTPDEITEGIVFLASDESRYMTGQCLVIDGGITL